MNKTELLQALAEARAELEAVLAGVPEAEWLTPGAAGDDWTVKDVLSHLTACEAEVVTGLARVRRGKPPGKVNYTPDEIQAQNARWHAENKDRPLDRVRADFQGVRKQLIRQVESFTEQELAAPRRWLKAAGLADWVHEEIVEHEVEHARDLRAWSQR